MSLALRGSVLGKAVLGLGFFCVLGLGLEPCVLDSTSGYLHKLKIEGGLISNLEVFHIQPILSEDLLLSIETYCLRLRKYEQISELATRGGVLEDVLGLEDVLEDTF